jgi:hypothetical protein
MAAARIPAPISVVIAAVGERSVGRCGLRLAAPRKPEENWTKGSAPR